MRMREAFVGVSPLTELFIRSIALLGVVSDSSSRRMAFLASLFSFFLFLFLYLSLSTNLVRIPSK